MTQTGNNFNRQFSSKSIMSKVELLKQNFVGTVVDSGRPQTASIMNKNMVMEAKNTHNLV